MSGTTATRARPACPTGAVLVPAGTDLAAALAAAPSGTALRLEPGTYTGPLAIERAVTLWGPPEAVVRSVGTGSTIEVRGGGAALLGFTVDGSGGRFDLLDAAVRVHGVQGVRVEGVAVRGALFGILIESTARAIVRGCEVEGTGGAALGLRGDGIRLWETTDSLVSGNRVTESRDLVVWYSSRNRVEKNLVVGGRYGTHFMYSHGNVVEGNDYIANTVGIFIMYSSDIEVRRNLIARSHGAAGVGIGLKETGDVTIAGNRLLHDTIGIYDDRSPLRADGAVTIEDNEIRLGNTAIVFHSSPRSVAVRRNVFRDNQAQARVEGGGDALGIEWRENDFDDYAGYDMDGDGFGDVPYELVSFSGELVARYPDVAFFRGTPALGMVDVAGHVFPILKPHKLLVDPRPRVGARAAGGTADAN
jgi:nitrous oxidase accessory protein